MAVAQHPNRLDILFCCDPEALWKLGPNHVEEGR
jgi:hypothetical protein